MEVGGMVVSEESPPPMVQPNVLKIGELVIRIFAYVKRNPVADEAVMIYAPSVL
jgi:hypothetical protein